MDTNLALCEMIPRAKPSAAPIGIPVAEAAHVSELLSSREEEIAQLAAGALSNKEIGLRLGISHWTVATHLRRIFIKLEITRRIELCRLIRSLT